MVGDIPFGAAASADAHRLRTEGRTLARDAAATARVAAARDAIRPSDRPREQTVGPVRLDPFQPQSRRHRGVPADPSRMTRRTRAIVPDHTIARGSSSVPTPVAQ